MARYHVCLLQMQTDHVEREPTHMPLRTHNSRITAFHHSFGDATAWARTIIVNDKAAARYSHDF